MLPHRLSEIREGWIYLNNCACIATWQLITFIRMFTFCKQTRVDVGLYANITLAVCSGKVFFERSANKLTLLGEINQTSWTVESS